LTQQVAFSWQKQNSSRISVFWPCEWLRILLALVKTPELRLGCRFGVKPDYPTAAKLIFLGNKLHMVQMALLQGPLILIDTD
jgi:hypothetical protein